MSAIQIQSVSKVIKGKKIIDSLSLEVHKGEVFGLLGPNGAGKTTTIRMIVGLISMTEGDIKIAGSSIKTDFEKAISRIGAIIENPEMYKFLSGYQNLLHFSRMSKGISKKKIEEVVELVGLKNRIHEKVKTYSLGMRQRLGLAQCLLHDPDVLILDEPTNGLDPAGIREIRDHLRMLAREKNMAIIVSSHLLSEMEMMCDRIGIIQQGKLLNVQSVQEFVQSTNPIFELEVEPKEKAITILKHSYPEGKVEEKEKAVTILIEKKEIPNIVKKLVEKNVHIYGIKEKRRTLEESFLELTTNGEGSKYDQVSTK